MGEGCIRGFWGTTVLSLEWVHGCLLYIYLLNCTCKSYALLYVYYFKIRKYVSFFNKRVVKQRGQQVQTAQEAWFGEGVILAPISALLFVFSQTEHPKVWYDAIQRRTFLLAFFVLSMALCLNPVYVLRDWAMTTMELLLTQRWKPHIEKWQRQGLTASLDDSVKQKCLPP